MLINLSEQVRASNLVMSVLAEAAIATAASIVNRERWLAAYDKARQQVYSDLTDQWEKNFPVYQAYLEREDSEKNPLKRWFMRLRRPRRPEYPEKPADDGMALRNRLVVQFYYAILHSMPVSGAGEFHSSLTADLLLEMEPVDKKAYEAACTVFRNRAHENGLDELRVHRPIS